MILYGQEGLKKYSSNEISKSALGKNHPSVQSWIKSMETICSSHKSLYRDLPLYEDHEIRRAAAGEPTLLE